MRLGFGLNWLGSARLWLVPGLAWFGGAASLGVAWLLAWLGLAWLGRCGLTGWKPCRAKLHPKKHRFWLPGFVLVRIFLCMFFVGWVFFALFGPFPWVFLRKTQFSLYFGRFRDMSVFLRRLYSFHISERKERRLEGTKVGRKAGRKEGGKEGILLVTPAALMVLFLQRLL